MSNKRAYLNSEEVKYSSTLEGDYITIHYSGFNYKFLVQKNEKNIILKNTETGQSHFISNATSGIVFNGKSIVLEKRRLREGGGDDNAMGSLLTPMPGKVIKVYVTVGQELKSGDKLYSMEAMKMEHTICCQEDAVVANIHFNEGDQVEASVEVVSLAQE